MTRGECPRCGKMVGLTLDFPRRLRRHRFAGDVCRGTMETLVDPETKFGAVYNREMRQHTERISAERGLDPNVFNAEVFFAASAAYRDAHANDPTLRQRQEAARAQQAPRPSRALTTEERAYLLELLRRQNDPLAASIVGKLGL